MTWLAQVSGGFSLSPGGFGEACVDALAELNAAATQLELARLKLIECVDRSGPDPHTPPLTAERKTSHHTLRTLLDVLKTPPNPPGAEPDEPGGERDGPGGP